MSCFRPSPWADRAMVCGLLLLILNPINAAQLQTFDYQAATSLNQLGLLPRANFRSSTSLQEMQRNRDFKNNLHIRAQETYQGYPVWGAELIMHYPQAPQTLESQSLTQIQTGNPQGVMNGRVYQDMDADLKFAPADIFEVTGRDQALAEAIKIFQQNKGSSGAITDAEVRLQIYVDANQKAHWVYYIQFTITPAVGLPSKPCFLLDAINHEVYQTWNNLQTRVSLSHSLAGGFGGNRKTGRLLYDGENGNFPALEIKRDDRAHSCYLQNREVLIKDLNRGNATAKFACSQPDKLHNNVYWDGSLDAVNGGFSPSNDAMFIGKIINDMYKQWYGIPPLVKNGRPMRLIMRVHDEGENAYWDGSQMTFGDGENIFYPLVSLSVGAHEISHGFTEQHSHLDYYGQSGGLNESFSDMAAQAAEYFARGHNSWLIGTDVMKADNSALRYMEHPAKDCASTEPGQECSIENMRDYHEEMDNHYSSGIFNRAFYLIAASPGWTTKKAFDVMVQANRYYWTPTTSFVEAACGVVKAVRDYGYTLKDVVQAFSKVGLNTRQCHFD